jgi:DNA-binding NtrC family response regulator
MANIKVLIVDDEMIMRESLSGWLARDGHDVETAASGEEALAKLKHTRFSILRVDIKMEGMSGLELPRQVKETDPDADVIVITAYGSIATAIEAMKNGAFDYLLKPFDPNEDEMMLYEWPRNVRELENAIERAVVVVKEPIIGPEDLPILCHPQPAIHVGSSLQQVEKATSADS